MCRSRVQPGLGCIYKQHENAISRRGKTQPWAHKLNVEFEFRSTWPGTRTIREAIPQQAISAQKEALTEATSTGREQHKYSLYALYFDVGEPRTIQGVW